MRPRQTSTDLAVQLREAFRRSGLSRFAWAKQAGVSYAIVHRFVAGQRDLKLRTVSKLCDVLGLTLRPAGQELKRSKGTKRKG